MCERETEGKETEKRESRERGARRGGPAARQPVARPSAKAAGRQGAPGSAGENNNFGYGK